VGSRPGASRRFCGQSASQCLPSLCPRVSSLRSCHTRSRSRSSVLVGAGARPPRQARAQRCRPLSGVRASLRAPRCPWTDGALSLESPRTQASAPAGVRLAGPVPACFRQAGAGHRGRERSVSGRGSSLPPLLLSGILVGKPPEPVPEAAGRSAGVGVFFFWCSRPRGSTLGLPTVTSSLPQYLQRGARCSPCRRPGEAGRAGPTLAQQPARIV